MFSWFLVSFEIFLYSVRSRSTHSRTTNCVYPEFWATVWKWEGLLLISGQMSKLMTPHLLRSCESMVILHTAGPWRSRAGRSKQRQWVASLPGLDAVPKESPHGGQESRRGSVCPWGLRELARACPVTGSKKKRRDGHLHSSWS